MTGALDDGTTVKLPAQHTRPNRSDRLPAGRHPLHYMPRPDLWTLRGADSRRTGGVCVRGTKVKQVVAGVVLAATRSRRTVAAGIIVHVKVILKS